MPINWKEPTGEEKEYYVGFQVDVCGFISPFIRTDETQTVLLGQLNDALGAPPAPVPAAETRSRVDYSEARAPGDEPWAET